MHIVFLLPSSIMYTDAWAASRLNKGGKLKNCNCCVCNCTVHRAKNKLMFWIPSHGFFFNLQRKREEKYTFLDVHYGKHICDINCMCGICKCKPITLLLGMVTLCTKLRISALAGPMLRVNCLIFFGPLVQPPLPSFSPFLPTCVIMWSLMTTDHINLPESTFIGH